MSDESGKFEIYVRPFSVNAAGTAIEPGGKWLISTGGGRSPKWNSNGRELYYQASDRKMMAVEITTSPAFRAGDSPADWTRRPGDGLGFHSGRQTFSDHSGKSRQTGAVYCGAQLASRIEAIIRWREPIAGIDAAEKRLAGLGRGNPSIYGMCTRSGGAIEAGQGSRFVIVYFNSESGSFFLNILRRESDETFISPLEKRRP